MAKINENYSKLKPSYLFSDIAKRVNAYTAKNPEKVIIRMGIGDVTKPLIPEVIDSMVSASKEMGNASTFRGYGPEQGYDFLKSDIVNYYATKMSVNLELSEVFISDGAKSDIANITDIFDNDNTVIIPDPVYPVYLDSNIMLGRKITLIAGNEANGFLPMPMEGLKGDIIYLCSPNNPTGAVYSKKQLKVWVDFALKNQAVILFDAAYESFITEKDLPRSIFEIEGAKNCAIEFCSFSKTAGFTGTRCGYTVVPNTLKIGGVNLNGMWLRRQTTKFNGVPYVVQKAASAVFTADGQKGVNDVIKYYLGNANVMAATLIKAGIWFTGGINSPYIWLKCPNNMDSWAFFDLLLNEAGIVGTPGSGFGDCGQGYFRLTAFNTRENTIAAMERLSKLLNK